MRTSAVSFVKTLLKEQFGESPELAKANWALIRSASLFLGSGAYFQRRRVHIFLPQLTQRWLLERRVAQGGPEALVVHTRSLRVLHVLHVA
jgi:hypothetical protein